MANELMVLGEVTYLPTQDQDGYDQQMRKFVSIVGATHRWASLIQQIATSNTAIDFSGVTPGYVLIRNLDGSNYVELNEGAAPSTYTIRLKAGEFALFRMGGATLTGKANTAAVNVQFVVFEA